jgi:hypothetical protein
MYCDKLIQFFLSSLFCQYKEVGCDLTWVKKYNNIIHRSEYHLKIL